MRGLSLHVPPGGWQKKPTAVLENSDRPGFRQRTSDLGGNVALSTKEVCLKRQVLSLNFFCKPPVSVLMSQHDPLSHSGRWKNVAKMSRFGAAKPTDARLSMRPLSA